jgi:2-keto-4-pentenoate hydratase/2-oxohepta-3-ene-1,7-dioic acid hydratase in catechol pathway
MKLVMFRSEGKVRPGAVREDRIVDLSSVAQDTLALIDQGEAGLQRARSALMSRRGGVPVADADLLQPLTPRGNVLCVGLNYRKHAEEGARLGGGKVNPPTIFTKAATSLIGPYDDIVADDSVTRKLDWEVELGLVIGEPGANVRAADALDHVFGYTVLNDVSARDVQHGWGGQWFKGKSIDATSPCGPWLVTSDEVADPQSLDLVLRVNGVVKQSANTAEMIYPIAELIEWMSIGMTLPAGCLIATGTPEGVGNARTPPEYLKPGDVMETEVDALGLLRNRVIRPPR